MNARVGNTSAQPIDPRLVVQAVGLIQGVVIPAASARNRPQQATTGKISLVLALAASLMPSKGRRTIHATYGTTTTHGDTGSQPRGVQVPKTGHEHGAATAACV